MKNQDTIQQRMIRMRTQLETRPLQLGPPRSRMDEWMGWALLILCTAMVGGGIWEMAVALGSVPQRCVGIL
jgi:hypothetical protein